LSKWAWNQSILIIPLPDESNALIMSSADFFAMIEENFDIAPFA